MNTPRYLLLAAIVAGGCAHVEVQSVNQCDSTHFALSAPGQLPTGLLMMSNSNGLSFDTTLSAVQLPASSSFDIALSPLTLTLGTGTWNFASRVTLTMAGSDPKKTPVLSVSDYTLTAADRSSSVLEVPLVVPSEKLVSYLRSGPLTLTLGLVPSGAAIPTSDLSLRLCHTESASFAWNIVSGSS